MFASIYHSYYLNVKEILLLVLFPKAVQEAKTYTLKKVLKLVFPRSTNGHFRKLLSEQQLILNYF